MKKPVKDKDPWAFNEYRCKCGNVFPADLGKYGCCDGPAKPIFLNKKRKTKK